MNKYDIPISNNKDVKFFRQNLIDITVKDIQGVSRIKKYYLILK